MNEPKHQQRALELISDLEQLAVEAQLKTRIIDTLKERKKELQSPLMEGQWEKELLLIDETVAYMEKQFADSETDVVMSDGNTVSKEEIRNRIQQIWSQCREIAKNLQNTYRRTQSVSRQKLESDMMDWTNVSANYEIMSYPSRFQAKCHETGQAYKQQVDRLASEYVEESAGEYERSMDKIKGFISSVDRGQIAVTTRDIYEKWDTQQESIRQNLKRHAEQIEKGETDIFEFGLAHMEPMNQIVRQKKRKRVFYCWIPLLVILVFFLVKGGISYINTSSNQQEETAVQEENSFAERLASKVIDKTSDAIAERITGNLSISFGKALLPLAILLLFAWVCWIQYTRKLYRSWLIRDLERYIKPQIELFWKENRILHREEECFQGITDMTIQYYDDVIKNILGNEFEMEQESSPKQRMKELKRNWNEIKSM